jgi:hypothetical protein
MVVLVRSLALAALLACGNATCSFTADYDCNGDDVAMLRQFGVNQTKCCEACAADARCAMAVLATDQGGVCLLKSACSDPRPGAKHRVLCNTGGVPPPPPAPAPGLVPKWAPTYFMAESTVIMPCNYSGLYDFDAYPALGRFGLVDYDWSNAKTYWANQSPMVCQGSMLQQAAQNKARTPSAKVFHYRNIVKALPWFEQVREKLLDPAYRGWFLPWRPGLRNGTTAGGQLYHDHEQTPGWPQPGGGQPADGVCHNHTTPPWGRGCDCGAGIPCGEYVFDHRNASLAAWLAGEYMNSSAFGLGNPLVDGFYLDDYWDEAAGPSEMDGAALADMGLAAAEVADITAAWRTNMAACQAAIVENGGFNWQLFEAERAPAQPQCASFLRDACRPGSKMQTRAVQLSPSVNKNKIPQPWTFNHIGQDVATFLLARGDYSWLGYGWMGCGCGWEDDDTMDCGGYLRDPSWEVDYGEPEGLCNETASGVFVREWTKATVRLDCNTFTPTITMKP